MVELIDDLENFGKQIEEGIQLGKNIKIESDVKNIVVAAMGGSCLSGEILKSYLDLEIPIVLNKDYKLPKVVGEGSLVFVISYSGNTEETLSMFKEALLRKAKIVVICAGGKLKELAQENNVPFVLVPSGHQPRASFGFIFFSILNVLVSAGLIGLQEEYYKELLEVIKNFQLKEFCKEIAEKFNGKVPVIYSSKKMAAVAYKWKIDINENSKQDAFWNFFPELNHNEINGFFKLVGKYHVVIIKDQDDHERIKKRMDVMKQLVEEKGVDVTVVELETGCLLTRLFFGIYIGDWVSYYLAQKNNVDPTQVEMVENFKRLIK